MSSTTPELNVTHRELLGTSACKRLRRNGQLPAIVYGRGEEVVNLSVDTHQFNVLLNRQEAGGLVTLKAKEGADIPVIVKDIQFDPRRNEPRTLDFLRVSLTETVATVVPIVLEGEPAGVRLEDGVLVQSLHEIDVEALPANLPEQITVDVTELEMNASIRVSDITFPEGVTSEVDPEELLASVAPPRVEEEPEEAEAVEGEEGEEAAAEGEEGEKAETAEGEKEE